MNPLPVSPLPSERPGEDPASPAIEEEGFVDEAWITAMIATPLKIRFDVPSQDLAPITDDLDFAGWRAPRPAEETPSDSEKDPQVETLPEAIGTLDLPISPEVAIWPIKTSPEAGHPKENAHVFRRATPPEMDEEEEETVSSPESPRKFRGWLVGILLLALIAAGLVALFQFANRSGLFFHPASAPNSPAAPAVPKPRPSLAP